MKSADQIVAAAAANPIPAALVAAGAHVTGNDVYFASIGKLL